MTDKCEVCGKPLGSTDRVCYTCQSGGGGEVKSAENGDSGVSQRKSEFELWEEGIKERLELALRQLESMTVDQFQGIFLPNFSSGDYHRDTDQIEFTVNSHRKHGINRVRWIHKRGFVDGELVSPPVPEEDELILEKVNEESWSLYDAEDDPRQARGDSLRLIHPVTTELDIERLMQAIYEEIRSVAKLSKPSYKTVPDGPPRMLYQYDSPTKEVTGQIGDPYSFPDTSLPKEKQINPLDSNELIDELTEIDLGNPMAPLECRRLPEECARTDSIPDEIHPQDNPALYNQRWDELTLQPEDDVRAIAAITFNKYSESEEWSLKGIWHRECGPNTEIFEETESGRGDSIGKHEVLVDASLEQGALQENPAGDYYALHLTDIKILSEDGEFADS